MDTKKLGNWGEKMACEYLVKNGYNILGRNYRINFGEIDIIAKKKGLFADKTIHFVEVKTSQDFHPEFNEGFSPEDRVGYKKQNKYRKLVEIWLEKNKLSQNYPCQIDIIAVSLNAINLKTEGPDEGRIDFFENIISG